LVHTGSSLPPGSILTLEYLDEALAGAEEAARWPDYWKERFKTS